MAEERQLYAKKSGTQVEIYPFTGWEQVQNKPSIPSKVTDLTDAAKFVTITDNRLTNARTPTAHAASHAVGAADAISPASIGAQPTILDIDTIRSNAETAAAGVTELTGDVSDLQTGFSGVSAALEALGLTVSAGKLCVKYSTN